MINQFKSMVSMNNRSSYNMDLQTLVKKTELVKKHYSKRGKDPKMVDQLIEKYNEWVVLIFKVDQYKRLKNAINKILPKKKTQTVTNVEAEGVEQLYNVILAKCAQTKTYGEAIESVDHLTFIELVNFSKLLKAITIETEKEANQLRSSLERGEIGRVYNMLHQSVPIGVDKLVTESVNIHDYPEDILRHDELMEKLGIVDMKLGTKIAGHRGYILRGQGVKLNRALISYALDFLANKEYELMEPPHMMTNEALRGVTQLEDYDETLYNCNGKFLIATSEQPLTAIWRDTLVRSKDYPIKICGLSHCYRKEAGSHGIDTKGIFRVHQFEKVEQFCITDPTKSWEQLEDMLKISMDFLDSLGLYYRVVNIHAEDLNAAASMKYDIEGHFPASENKYRELVSCTNCTDFISRRIHCKDDRHNYVHMLNSTLCANTRTLCCILETYQTEKGIMIPPALVPYMGGVHEILFME
jgi:seryl-tRNA synthetase